MAHRLSLPDPNAVLDFWFGAPGSTTFGKTRTEWFRKDSEFDSAIAAHFGAWVEEALRGGLAQWDVQPHSALARIVMLDQFPRNIYRGSARAFAGDRHALATARAMVVHGDDAKLAPVQRSFVYLPFEHAEDLQLQEQSVALFAALVEQNPQLAGMLDYAKRHRDVIRRFSRFPHRNAILGRVSTDEEVAYLAQPGSGF